MRNKNMTQFRIEKSKMSGHRPFQELRDKIKPERRAENERETQRLLKEPIEFEIGSGNVFADIGLPNADEHLMKANLVMKIDGVMGKQKLKRADVAMRFGITPTQVSKLLRGDFAKYTLDQLEDFYLNLQAKGSSFQFGLGSD